MSQRRFIPENDKYVLLQQSNEHLNTIAHAQRDFGEAKAHDEYGKVSGESELEVMRMWAVGLSVGIMTAARRSRTEKQ